jgi:hypothetical protein
MRLGIAGTDITPQESVPLLGYGDRTHDSTGVHDPLSAYAWWLESQGEAPLVWVVLDLCLLSVGTAHELTTRLSQEVGLPAGRVLLSTTHTHSGPDVRSLPGNPAAWARRYHGLLRERMRSAVEQARRSAFDGVIEVHESHCDIGANRRDDRLPADTRVILLRLVDRAGRERGSIFHYSCHLTVLGVENYLVSSDWVGPVRLDLERQWGVPVAFLQGAEGNVDPRCRGVLDMGDPDQARGSSFETCRELGGRMSACLREAAGGEPLLRLSSVRQVGAVAPLPLRYGALSAGQIEERILRWKQALGGLLGVAPQRVPEDSGVNALVKARCRQLRLPRPECRKWVAEQFAYYAFLNIYKQGGELVDREKGLLNLPTVLLDFGGLVLLCVPAEVLVEVAFEWQRRLASRVALVAGLCNGWSGYLPHGDNFREADSGSKYETASTVFSEQAAQELLDRAQELAARGG